MRKLIATVVLVVTQVGAGGLAVPAAHAVAPDRIQGGCFFNSDGTAATGDTQTGVIGDRSETTTGDFPPMPIGAAVTCWIDVNGVAAPGTTHTYGDLPGVPGVQAGVDTLVYTAPVGEPVYICQSVQFADGTSIPAECPPYQPRCGIEGWDCLNDLFTDYIDPAVCPELVALAGSYPDGVTVEPDGDVYVPDPAGLGLNPVYDCPPYYDYPPYT